MERSTRNDPESRCDRCARRIGSNRGRPRRTSKSAGSGRTEVPGDISECLQRLEMVACLLLQMPWHERGWHDAGAGFDRSQREAAAQGVSADCSKRERRRHHAVLGQAARRETDHATLYLRQGQDRQSAAARETRRGRTEWWSLAPAQRLAQAAVGARTSTRAWWRTDPTSSSEEL